MGEFAGTLVLILLGDGVVANVLLKRSKAEGGGWMVITTGWAFAVLCGIFTAVAFGSADAHINPAVTLAFAIMSGNYSKIVPYWSAQILGAFAGATLVWLYFLPHWKMTEDREAKLRRVLHCACDSPLSRQPVLRSGGHHAADRGDGCYRLEGRGSRRTDAGHSARTSSRYWCGRSDCRWAERPATPSIPRAISARAWRMLYGRWQGREAPTGPMRRFR